MFKRIFQLSIFALLALGIISGSHQENFSKAKAQSKAGAVISQKDIPSPVLQPTPTIPVDIDGKRLPDGEKYLALRTLKDGKVIAYRKNKREVEALVAGLKEDGITDQKLLDPKNWLGFTCDFTGWKKCGYGCGNVQCSYHEVRNDSADHTANAKSYYDSRSNTAKTTSETGSASPPYRATARGVGYCSCP